MCSKENTKLSTDNHAQSVFRPWQFRLRLLEVNKTEPIAVNFWRNKCGIWVEKDHWTLASKCTSETRLRLLQWKIHRNIYDLVPKGAHARGYALRLKIKHCWKLFLFEMLCCVLAWMNEYIVQIISATRLWLISRYSHHTLKKCRKMTAKNGHSSTEWFFFTLLTNKSQAHGETITDLYAENIVLYG